MKSFCRKKSQTARVVHANELRSILFEASFFIALLLCCETFSLFWILMMLENIFQFNASSSQRYKQCRYHILNLSFFILFVFVRNPLQVYLRVSQKTKQQQQQFRIGSSKGEAFCQRIFAIRRRRTSCNGKHKTFKLFLFSFSTFYIYYVLLYNDELFTVSVLCIYTPESG